MNISLHSIITTINEPTKAIQKLVSRLHKIDLKLYVIGDKKGPTAYPLEGAIFLSLQDQLDSQFELARKLPTDHYARKNVGYLTAIAQGASCIYETDDDNAPLPNWTLRQETVTAKEIEGHGWVNVYKYFTDKNIWPRGFPLDEINSALSPQSLSSTLNTQRSPFRSPIQQGLVNNSPDVDAIWRLVLDRPFDFQQSPSVYLPPQCWCPFNSQSTWWWPVAYPLLYLPSYCSFRMTDIWRSFIAQRCMWELGYGVVFHAPEVIQERNAHNLIKNFKDEMSGYTRNKEFVAILEGLSLDKGLDAMSRNLEKCYDALIAEDFFPESEIELVRTWLTDLEKASS